MTVAYAILGVVVMAVALVVLLGYLAFAIRELRRRRALRMYFRGGGGAATG